MREKEIRVRIIVEGNAEGEILIYPKPISFLGEVDPKKGVFLSGGKEFSLKGKVFIFPNLRGSTVGSYVIYALRYYGNAPSAIIVSRADPILIAGAVLADIPLAEGISEDEISDIGKFSKAVLEGNVGLLKLLP
ncbi:MAG: DUF126 domain-containing protein [Desulfurococcales archaeon]|jgi:predicted aconitase with swiveling domain|uniref:DUF126 domain-containing protein n=1 Tax=Fervidicoccus fontis TaxID=683846 RepID=A0A7J3SL36_9CREN